MGLVLDVVLVVAAVLFGMSGYRQGLVVGGVLLAGFLCGGVIGAKLIAPVVIDHFVTGDSGPGVAVVIVFLTCLLGQVMVMPAAVALRRRLRGRPVQIVDACAGALVGVLGLLVFSWLIGTAMVHSPYRALARQFQHSRIETAVDRAMPDRVSTWFAHFQQVIDQGGFPQVFGGMGHERIPSVAPPDPAVAKTPAALAARHSVVEVVGDAPSCGKQVQGTGFVYAPGYVLTNAHVVAGVRAPMVTFARGGLGYEARVVLFDADRDVAVLLVPRLPTAMPTLPFADANAESGQDAVVVGFPEGGPLTIQAARVRGAQRVRGPNIYYARTVTRDVYALRSRIRPGDSGGPLLTPSGQVLGLVFAASYDDPQTGYALTDDVVRADADRGKSLADRVSTGRCTSG